jgi:hypothetical protein
MGGVHPTQPDVNFFFAFLATAFFFFYSKLRDAWKLNYGFGRWYRHFALVYSLGAFKQPSRTCNERTKQRARAARYEVGKSVFGACYGELCAVLKGNATLQYG